MVFLLRGGVGENSVEDRARTHFTPALVSAVATEAWNLGRGRDLCPGCSLSWSLL